MRRERLYPSTVCARPVGLIRRVSVASGKKRQRKHNIHGLTWHQMYAGKMKLPLGKPRLMRNRGDSAILAGCRCHQYPQSNMPNDY